MKLKLFMTSGTFCLLILFGKLEAQNYKPYFSSAATRYGFLQYFDARSRNIFDYRLGMGSTVKCNFPKRKWMYTRISHISSWVKLTNPVLWESLEYHMKDDFHIESYNICIGYETRLIDGLSMGLYGGFLINEFDLLNPITNQKKSFSRFGMPIGVDFEFQKLIIEKKRIYFTANFCNTLGYSSLKIANKEIGNIFYSYEVGMGIMQKFNLKEAKKKTKSKKKKNK